MMMVARMWVMIVMVAGRLVGVVVVRIAQSGAVFLRRLCGSGGRRVAAGAAGTGARSGRSRAGLAVAVCTQGI